MSGSQDETPDYRADIARARDLLEVRMAERPGRLKHIYGVARTAVSLAQIYDVDPQLAELAGLLHDWDKVLSNEEILARAARYGVPIAGPAHKAAHVLHGPVAARELRELFSGLPDEVFLAIERHTVASVSMTPLDMVVFVADAIEPMRRGDHAESLRSMVGNVDLEHLFFACFTQGLIYVLSTGRYLYPTAQEVYNSYVDKLA